MKDLKIYKRKRVYGKYALLCAFLLAGLCLSFFISNTSHRERMVGLGCIGFFGFIFSYFLYHYLDRKPVYHISDEGIFYRRGKKIVWDTVDAFQSEEDYLDRTMSVILFNKHGEKILHMELSHTNADLREVESRLRSKRLERLSKVPQKF